MTCEHATELLPWLLNGTLEPVERQEVLAHVRGCPDCRRALDEARLALAAAGAHLPAEALVAMAFGEPVPPGIDAALVEEHLAACPQCAADLELARTSHALADEEVLLFPRTAPPAAAPARQAAPAGRWRAAALAAGLAAVLFAGGWLTNRQALDRAEEQLAGRTAPPAAVAPGGGRPEDDRAAGLAAENRRLRDEAAAREAGEQAAREEAEDLRQQLARREAPAGGGAAPQLNPVIADLFPPGADVVRGGGETGTTIELPAGAGGATLILNTGGPSAFREHAVELRDAAGKRVWSARGLLAQPEGAFHLHLPRQALAPGAYTLEVYGLDGARREKVQTYKFTVR
ncbi:MAG TPA: zf-HC2 domain-containing protein [Thermoanaerobaculia bacterium]